MKFLKTILGWIKRSSRHSDNRIVYRNQPSVVKAGVYRHFKGNHYFVFGGARHSETEEWMVVYAPEPERDETWVRPLSKFEELVQVESGEVQRFTLVSAHVS